MYDCTKFISSFVKLFYGTGMFNSVFAFVCWMIGRDVAEEQPATPRERVKSFRIVLSQFSSHVIFMNNYFVLGKKFRF